MQPGMSPHSANSDGQGAVAPVPPEAGSALHTRADALLAAGRAIVFYDGKCLMCNKAVQYILRHDREAVFYFAALQSNLASAMLGRHGIADPVGLGSMVVLTKEGPKIRSEGMMEIAGQLDGAHPLIRILGRGLPRAVRDRLYDVIATHRKEWFGQAESCPLPTAATRERFLEDA